MEIILVCIDNFQHYILTNVQQLLDVGNKNITVICNKQFFAYFKQFPVIKLVDIEDLQSKQVSNYITKSPLDRSNKNGFWVHCTSRFFYLTEYMRKYDIRDIVHLENDVMLYAQVEDLLPQLRTHDMFVAMDSPTRCIPGIVYVKNYKILDDYVQSLDMKKNDMMSLGEFFNKTEKCGNLPIIHHHHHYGKYSELFEGVFDAAGIGQYLGGIDPRNSGGRNTIGFINETCEIKYNNYKFTWREKNGLYFPYIGDYPVYNIHIHSKRLQAFLSKNPTEFTLISKKDEVSGSVVSEMTKIFGNIYATNQWDNGSGGGSKLQFNEEFITKMRKLFNEFNITQVCDLACGDGQCIEELYKDTGIDYTGIDCVKSIIDVNKANFPHYNFKVVDMFSEELPDSQCYILKDVLQDWNIESIYKFMDRLVQKKFSYIFIINCCGQTSDIQNCHIGGGRPLSISYLPLKKYGATKLFNYKTKEVSVIYNIHPNVKNHYIKYPDLRQGPLGFSKDGFTMYQGSGKHVTYYTMSRFLDLVSEIKNPVIVETGSNAHGAKSTSLLDSFVTEYGGSLWSVDINPKVTEECKKIVSKNTHMVTDDSINFLKNWDKLNPDVTIDALYLDSFDLDWNDYQPSANHGFKELEAVLPFLSKYCVILIDDTPISPKYIPTRDSIYEKICANYKKTGIVPGKGMDIVTRLNDDVRFDRKMHLYQVLYTFEQ